MHRFWCIGNAPRCMRCEANTKWEWMETLKNNIMLSFEVNRTRLTTNDVLDSRLIKNNKYWYFYMHRILKVFEMRLFLVFSIQNHGYIFKNARIKQVLEIEQIVVCFSLRTTKNYFDCAWRTIKKYPDYSHRFFTFFFFLSGENGVNNRCE